ncbi:MAG: hypothetical protein IJH64_08460 [Oscillospiraceae bacterium]|nr:hypothetical protein [Oscillospiraceae bacterium]
MPNIDVEYSKGDKVWIPARVLHAEIHENETYYRIVESDTYLIPQRFIKDRKDSELDNYD